MKILVLDKDLNERVAIQQVVQQNGHEIVSAENSETAMQLLQEGDIRFVIADRVTTDMEEKRFVRGVRDAKPPYHIYILVLTPQSNDATITPALDGADDSLVKEQTACLTRSTATPLAPPAANRVPATPQCSGRRRC